MNILRTFSFVGYSMVILAGLVTGLMYSFASKIMPYYLKAMNSSWEEFNGSAQWMLLNFQRSIAAGFITTSVALIFLLIFAFRKRYLWALYALFGIAFVEWGNILLRTISVRSNTMANPPLGTLVFFIVLIILSFVASLISYKEEEVK